VLNTFVTPAVFWVFGGPAARHAIGERAEQENGEVRERAA